MPNAFFRDRAIARIRDAINSSARVLSIDHMGVRGDLRELAVEELLRPFLPARYSFATGKIADSTGRQSSQVDLAVYDPSELPALLSGRLGMVPIETCLSTIEVKTKLTGEEFASATSNAESVRSLQPAVSSWSDSDGRVNWKLAPCAVVPAFLFAFSGPKPETILAWVKAADDGNRLPPLRGVCVLGTGFFWRPTVGEWQVTQATKEHDEVLAFIAQLEASIWKIVRDSHRDAGSAMGRYLVGPPLAGRDDSGYG